MKAYGPLIVAAVAGCSILLSGCNNKPVDHEDESEWQDTRTEPVTGGDLLAPVDSGPAGPALTPPAADPSKPVVTVNGKHLTRGEADRRIRMIAMRQGVPPQAMDQALQMMGPQLKEQVIEQFIDVTLLLDEAERRELSISDEQVDEILNAILADMPPEMDFDEMLAAQGVSRQEIREDIRKSEKIKTLVEAHAGGLEPATEAQIAAFYAENSTHFETAAQVSASHILVMVDADAPDADKATARATIEEIQQKLATGEAEFEALAREHSECPSSAQGGSLGTFGRGQMVGPFEEAAFSQPIGEVGPVVETRFGYHLIKVTDRTDAGVTPLEDARADIIEHLEGDQKGQKIQELLGSLREDAAIVRH